ncbi:MAG TPA: hypothetical protein GX519_02160, partial [Thermoanaerobacterales bacterium]|nr:hypothetical protein [Thermoanaerobacterales bacterium]
MAVRVDELGNHKYRLHFSEGTGDERIRKTKIITIRQPTKSKERAIAYQMAEEFERTCLLNIRIFDYNITFEEYALQWLKKICLFGY